MRVYCLKTLNKLSIYPLGNTPSAPSGRGEVKTSGDEIGTFNIVQEHGRGWPSETSWIPKGTKWDERQGKTVKE